MNRCLSFNEGTAIRGDSEYYVDASSGNEQSETLPATEKWEGPGEHSEKFGD